MACSTTRLVLFLLILDAVPSGSMSQQPRRHIGHLRDRHNNFDHDRPQGDEDPWSVRTRGNESPAADGTDTAPGQEMQLAPSSEEAGESSRPLNETLAEYERRNCSSCMLRHEAKLSRLEQIKRDLLAKLGMTSAPNITIKDMLPTTTNGPINVLLRQHGFGPTGQVYQSDSPQADDYRAKTEHIYSFATRPPVNLSISLPSHRDRQIAYFKFSPQTRESNLHTAVLHYYIQSPPEDYAVTDRHQPLRVRIERVVWDRRKGFITKEVLVEEPKLRHHSLSHAVDRWHEVNVLEIVGDWFRKPELNFGLILRVELNGHNLAVFPTSEGNDNEHNMYIDLVTEHGVQSRSRRDINPNLDCEGATEEKRCCRHPLVVDFQSFGWDWVIAPKRYKAYYCNGECPLKFLQQYPHTHIMHSAGVGPCCTPSAMTEMMMIYFTENKEVHVAKVPGMVVSRCGCA